MENEDPVAIAQTGINPFTGSYLSSEQRKALFKRAVAPSSILGGGGALVKRTDDSSAVVVAQTQKITELQDQIDTIRAKVSILTTGLTSINNIIERDGVLEQQRLIGEKEEERRNLEQKVRAGKEDELEKKIQSALLAPIAAVQKKVGNIFDNIFGALSTLFMGWLTNQGIETLKALEQGNKEKLEQIKDTVLKNIAYAIGGLAAIKIGFGLIIRTVVGLAARIGAIAVRLALAPFRFLGNQLAKVPGALGKVFGIGGAKKPPTLPKVKPTASGGNLWTRATNFFRGAGPATRGATAGAVKTGGSLISKLFAPVNIGISAYRFSQGDIPGGILSAISAIPGLGLPAVGVDIAREFGAFEGTFLGKNEKERQSQTKQESAPAITPQETMMPQTSELSITPPQEPTPSADPQTPMMSQMEIQEPTPSAAPQTTMMPQVGIQEPTPSADPQTTMMPQTVVSPLIQEPTIASTTVSEPSAEMVKNFEMAWKYKDNPMARGRIESAWNKMTPEQKIQAQNWATSKGYDWKEMKLSAPPAQELTPSAAPQTTMMPLESELTLSPKSQDIVSSFQEDAGKNMMQMNIDTEKAYTMPFLISESQIQNIPIQLPNIGSLPEPEANVVMLPAPQSKQRQSMINPSSAGSDVPLINSANPDNFYVLYSQLNYNVVM